MIFRLSQKLAKKIKAGALDTVALDENPYADWSAHPFTANRAQYIILSNTKSLYSCVMYGKGITDDSVFIERALSTIREFTEDDGQAFVYQRFIAPASGTVQFAKALNRTVTGGGILPRISKASSGRSLLSISYICTKAGSRKVFRRLRPDGSNSSISMSTSISPMSTRSSSSIRGFSKAVSWCSTTTALPVFWERAGPSTRCVRGLSRA